MVPGISRSSAIRTVFAPSSSGAPPPPPTATLTPAPAPHSTAPSRPTAALTPPCRVASIELAPHNGRVNIVHPDAVFDTKLWPPEALEKSAARYGMTVEEYKTKNLMKVEIKSKDIGNMVHRQAKLIRFHRQVMPFFPGDIISSGTPGAGILRHGVVATASVSGMEPLVNPVVAQDGASV